MLVSAALAWGAQQGSGGWVSSYWGIGGGRELLVSVWGWCVYSRYLVNLRALIFYLHESNVRLWTVAVNLAKGVCIIRFGLVGEKMPPQNSNRS